MSSEENTTVKPPVRIGKKIVGYGVAKPGDADKAEEGVKVDPSAGRCRVTWTRWSNAPRSSSARRTS